MQFVHIGFAAIGKLGSFYERTSTSSCRSIDFCFDQAIRLAKFQ